MCVVSFRFLFITVPVLKFQHRLKQNDENKFTKLNYFSLKCFQKWEKKTKIHTHRSNLKHKNNKKKTKIDKMNFEDNAFCWSITSVWIFVFQKNSISTCSLHKFHRIQDIFFRETINNETIKFESILIRVWLKKIQSLKNYNQSLS